MITVRNRGVQARSIDLDREYEGVGRSIYLRPKEIRTGLPNEISTEKRLTRLAGHGIIEITRQESQPPEMKSERKPRRAAEAKSEREE
jgi:hypothetical protein